MPVSLRLAPKIDGSVATIVQSRISNNCIRWCCPPSRKRCYSVLHVHRFVYSVAHRVLLTMGDIWDRTAVVYSGRSIANASKRDICVVSDRLIKLAGAIQSELFLSSSLSLFAFYVVSHSLHNVPCLLKNLLCRIPLIHLVVEYFL